MRSRRQTFFLWAIAVAGALGFQVSHSGICTGVSIGCLTLIFALLCTTPEDAIRLPRWVSEIFILLTTAVLRAHTGVPGRIHFGITVLTLMILRLWNKSSWWAVLFAWLPVV
jgi:hypothetical protein